MAMLYNRVLDEGLNVLITATGLADKMYLCSAEPTTYTEAITTYALGWDNGNLVITGPADRAGGGREVTMAALNNNGIATATGFALWYAIVDDGATELLATGPCTSQAITSGNSFSTNQVKIGIPDPA
jgi:hypothetical protein